MNSRVEQPAAQARERRADVLLLLVALIWGSTFVLVKGTVSRFPVFAFLSLRFSLAAAVLFFFFAQRLRSLSRRTAFAGAVIGLFLFGGYALQTLGLQYTSASKAGFLTGLSVVMVPVFSAMLLRLLPDRSALLGVFFSTVGLGLLTLGSDLNPARGDWMVFGCAVCFALHITLVSRFAPRSDALALTTVQIAVVAVLSAAASLTMERWPWPADQGVYWAAAFTGVLATAMAFGVQNTMQIHTTATHTALIFAMEPVFAAVFGYLLAGERLTAWGLAGCGLILLGMLLAELKPGTRLRSISNLR